MLEHQPKVIVDGAFGVELGGLFAANGGGDFGEDVFQEAAFAEEVEAAGGIGRPKKLEQFVADAFGADGPDLRGEGLEGGEGFGLDLKIELCGKANGPKEAEMVLIEAGGGGADGADQFGAEVLFAADPIVEFLANRLEIEAVDGEIASLSIGLSVAEADVFGVAAILVIRFGTVSGDLKLMAVFDDHDNAEFAAHGDGVREERFNLTGQGGGDDIVITWFAAKEEIANAAADPQGVKAGGLETPDNCCGVFAQRVVALFGRAHGWMASD